MHMIVSNLIYQPDNEVNVRRQLADKVHNIGYVQQIKQTRR